MKDLHGIKLVSPQGQFLVVRPAGGASGVYTVMHPTTKVVMGQLIQYADTETHTEGAITTSNPLLPLVSVQLVPYKAPWEHDDLWWLCNANGAPLFHVSTPVSYIIDRTHRIAFGVIPKNACASLLRSTIQYSGSTVLANHNLTIHSNVHNIPGAANGFLFNPGAGPEIPEGFRRVVVVDKDPVARLLRWCNYCLNTGYNGYLRALPLPAFDFATFNAYAEYCIKTHHRFVKSPSTWDEHAALQVDLIDELKKATGHSDWEYVALNNLSDWYKEATGHQLWRSNVTPEDQKYIKRSTVPQYLIRMAEAVVERDINFIAEIKL